MGTSKTTQTAKATPYGPAQPLIQGQAQAGADYMANRDPTELAAANQTRDYLSSVVGGDYLNAGNPHTKALTDSIAADVMPRVNSTFANAGLANSSMHAGMLTKGLTQGMAQPLFAQYDAERARQMAAAGALPGVAFNATDAGAATNTLPISDAMKHYATKTGTSQTNPSLGAQIAGGALMGAQILGAPYTGGASMAGLGGGVSNIGALQGSLFGNPMGMDMGMHNWEANTSVSPANAPWVNYPINQQYR